MNSLITLSKTATKQFKFILKENNAKAILFSIKSGGCNGFEYELTPTNEKLKDGDEIHNENDITLHICGKSIMHILGTHIDWKKDIMGESFKFENPVAKQSCGCGTSFNPFN